MFVKTYVIVKLYDIYRDTSKWHMKEWKEFLKLFFLFKQFVWNIEIILHMYKKSVELTIFFCIICYNDRKFLFNSQLEIHTIKINIDCKKLQIEAHCINRSWFNLILFDWIECWCHFI